jgi:hypothetical protein
VEGRQDRLVALVGRQGDLHLAGQDDEQGVARIAGVEDHLAAAEAAGPRPGRDTLEILGVQPGEERDAGECRLVGSRRLHMGIVPPDTSALPRWQIGRCHVADRPAVSWRSTPVLAAPLAWAP